MERTSKIFVAGSKGLVGSALVRQLTSRGCTNLLLPGIGELDLTSQQDVADFFRQEKPEYVFLAAAKVGGIHANNTYPAEFIYLNLAIQNNVIHQSYLHRVKRLLFLGSSCIYPQLAPQPMKEEHLLTGLLEPTNEPYAIAKIAGIKMCEAYNRQYGTKFIAVMPTNLYGPGDNFHPENSHVLPALIRRFHEAKMVKAPEVVVWGSGTPRRDGAETQDHPRRHRRFATHGEGLADAQPLDGRTQHALAAGVDVPRRDGSCGARGAGTVPGLGREVTRRVR